MPNRRERQDPIAVYAAALQRELVRLLAGRYGLDADDIAHEVVCRFLIDAEDVMARTPDPIVHARRTAVNAGIDHWRRDSAQRGVGARTRRAAEGGREDRVTDHADAAPAVDDVVVDRQLLGGHLARLAVGDRELVVLHHGYGVPIGDLARRRRLTRETIGRRIRRALDQIAESPEPSESLEREVA
jgi:DNA-directed RNA polymerase specialized sigma24 family protein